MTRERENENERESELEQERANAHWRKQYRRLRATEAEPSSRPIPLAMIPVAVEAMGYPKPHPRVCRRWVDRGVHGVRLATSSDGARRYTTLAAIREFMRGAGLS